MEGVAVMGSLLFMLILIVSCGFEFYELYLGRREQEERGRSSESLLFPRRYYADLHRRNYEAPLPLDTGSTFLVKRSERPVRCEVCHQDDCFEINTGRCARCDHYTL